MNFQKLLIISKYTFSEFMKGKILYITFAVGFITMVMTYIATEFTYGVPEKIALDFGLGMLSVSSLGISIFMGVTLLSKEIDSRTVYMVISRPVPRYIFICGKIVGLLGVLAINIGTLSLMTIFTSKFLGGTIEWMTLISVLFNFLEAMLLLLVVVLFSLFSNTTIATIASILLLISGHAIKETQGALFVQGRPALKFLLETYHLVLPAFYKLNFKDFVVYRQSVPANFLWQSGAYGLLYSGFVFFLIIHFFNKKNLD